jgi:hypothetical protein
MNKRSIVLVYIGIVCLYQNLPRLQLMSMMKQKKKLLVDWVCTDIRPFSAINDDGLRSLVQECILLGISYM